MKNFITAGIGIRRKKNNTTLDVTYPLISLNTDNGLYPSLEKFSSKANSFAVISTNELQELEKEWQNTFSKEAHTVKTILSLNANKNSYYETDVIIFNLTNSTEAVTSAEEAYLKLQLLSQRFVLPHEINMDNTFGSLNNIAWTNYGPMLPQDVEIERLKRMHNELPLEVSHVDKFPYMVNYHIPSGVRIADGSRVRLGAHLAEGTTVMQAGFVNFNAGSKGHAMIEGRVSAGVLLGDHTDVGGGASIMGTLSGGGKHVIALGEKCLLGANAGTGISLGDGSTVAAGLYIYSGMKIALYNQNNEPVDLNNNVVTEGQNIVKARDINGRKNLLFIQDSQTGKVICKPNPKTIELNSQLHKN